MHGVPVLAEELDSPSSELLHPPPPEPLAARADDGQRDRELHSRVFLSAQGIEQDVRRAACEPELSQGHAAAGTLVRVERVELRDAARRSRRSRQRRGRRHASKATNARAPNAIGTMKTKSSDIRPTSIEPSSA